jgi:hypothetical protein
MARSRKKSCDRSVVKLGFSHWSTTQQIQLKLNNELCHPCRKASTTPDFSTALAYLFSFVWVMLAITTRYSDDPCCINKDVAAVG